MAKKAKETEVQIVEDKDKAKRIEEIQKNMEKKFGKGTVMGAREKPTYHEAISTGSLGLDKATGIGGLPRGRIVEIFGPESSGKTTLCLEVIANAHKTKDAWAAFVDVEHALDTVYAEKLGVDIDRLKISQPNNGEEALEITRQLIESGEFDVVIVDSVAALVPKSELEGEVGDAQMGKHARMMSQALRMLTSCTAKTNTILIFINQMRDKIGVMFGSPETTTGGNALKFYASMRLDIRRSIAKGNDIKDKNDIRIGNLVTVKVIKNKCAPPFLKAEFDVLYGEGVDNYGELVEMGVETGILTKSGTFFSYDGTSIGQGKAQVKETFKNNPELYQEIKKKVVAAYTPQEFAAEEED
jgi:recombination protein RecA